MNNVAFLLEQDLIEARPWQVWVNGARLAQANGTNPRIKQASIEDSPAIAVAASRQVGLVYEVRIVKTGINPAIIRSDSTWELSFDEGATRTPARVIPPIREKGSQGDAWLVLLELG